ncbi:putative disease resistance protein At4g11170 isoform X1 [Eucalyptus grandis]|uniref:putative disease resistance protein At4g11170 isoform X1 n=1 Tax=Eucalyptus grandis TaxID=71139 RepID=UPI00192E79CC|nr:putative disease resistance protein At4g11170 isoform X1 [Eucalyptus grandis]XP_039165031.1 putative disease resistance protein At4g11170 isoform X1 [Eucalyptus grandis]
MNFRGRDTRKGFGDYHYTSLVDAGVHVFRDEEICVGAKIGFDFPSVIAQTKISIVIISENFASSSWCLKELVHILECRRSRGQLVLPIYYKVKPLQLKYLTGRFRGAIDAHKRKMGEMVVNYWIEALREVTSVKGWKSEEFGHEGELVRSVVNEVMIALNGTKRIMSSIDNNEVPTKKPKAKVCEVFLSFRGKTPVKVLLVISILSSRMQEFTCSRKTMTSVMVSRLVWSFSAALCNQRLRSQLSQRIMLPANGAFVS